RNDYMRRHSEQKDQQERYCNEFYDPKSPTEQSGRYSYFPPDA
ncbi:hypothetical protein MNBD_GAMMA18-2380, partial [hydrothermal vent metagenome]